MTNKIHSNEKPRTYDERIKKMAENVSLAHRNPVLRKHLDDQKRLSSKEILDRILESQSSWTLLSDLAKYSKMTVRNLECECQKGHKSQISVNDIIANVRCRICQPRKNVGKTNASFRPLDSFFDKLLKKFGEDAFLFNPANYNGMYTPMEFQCSKCSYVFTKAPRVLMNGLYGCAECAKISRGDIQRRTESHFLAWAQKTHGGNFTYHYKLNQTFGNADTISRTCKTCNETSEQLIASHLHNGCAICSGMQKHTTASFIAKSKLVWGENMFDYKHVSYISNKTHVTLICKKKSHMFSCAPSNHFSKRGCPDCAAKKFVSIGETEWLDSLVIPENCRNKWLLAGGQKFNVDGFINGTIYEYYGDFWHGNLKRYAPEFINVFSGMTMLELNEHTMTREQMLKEAGYIVIKMWETDWMKIRNTRPGKQPAAVSPA
jgi:hypothetical protein